MTTSVIVPWRPDAAGERQPLWDWCRDRWEAEKLVDEIIECDSEQHPFTRGTSINLGVEQAKGDVIVIADADSFVGDVRAAIGMVQMGVPWVVNYGMHRYFRVDPATTEDYLSGSLSTRLDPFQYLERVAVAYSGCVVMLRSSFERAGGFDERFRGWGEEDVAFMEAMRVFVGDFARSNTFCVQLYHTHIEADRYQHPLYPANRDLGNRYAAARGDRESMLALIGEWNPRVLA